MQFETFARCPFARALVPEGPMQADSESRFARVAAGGLFLGLALAMAAACSSGESPSKEPGGGEGGSAGSAGTAGIGALGGTSGSGASGGSGGIIVQDGGLDGDVPPPDLPPPWQYFDEPGEKGFKDPALPDDVKEQFDGPPATSGDPDIVYPLEASMHPRNLTLITFHWHQGSGASTVFRITAEASGEKFHFFVPCSEAQCTYAMPESEWWDLGKRFAEQDVSFTVAGSDGAGGPVAVSGARTIRYSPDPVIGALYYWSANTETIKRATFGSKKAVPYIEPNSSTNQYACVACHSVSRDGKVIAFAVTELSGENIAGIQVAPTDDPANPWVEPPKGPTPYGRPDLNQGNTEGPTDFLGHNVALSPTGDVAAINGIPPDPDEDNWPPYLELRDAKTGATHARYDLGDPIFGGNRLGIHPEWSPDGNSLVVALADATGDTAQLGCVWTSDTCRSSIAVLPVTNGGKALGTAEVIVPNAGTDFHFYPSWSPDGKWLAFVSATWDKDAHPNEKSLGNLNGVVRLVEIAGAPHDCPGDECHELTNLTRYTPADAAARQGKHSTWPKFAPFAQGTDGKLFFIGYNSAIDYGFLASGVTQLWMSAVDLAQIGPGQDPSYAPIWLPYQELDDGSLTPYWTTELPCQLDPGGGCAGCVGDESCVVDQNNNCRCETIVK
jgi:hypothetical protein